MNDTRTTSSPPQEQAGLRVLICSPVEGLLGGIPAATRGLVAGLQSLPGISVLRTPYAYYRTRSSLLARFLRELLQIPVFVCTVLKYKPHIIQIESSFDRKTLVRDTVFAWLAHRLGRPVVLRSHGGSFDDVPRWHRFWRAWSREFLLKCDAVIVLARDTLGDLTSVVGHRRTFHVRPNPVAIPQQPRPRPHGSGNTGEIVIVSAGRLIRDKGVQDLVASMRHVSDPRAVLYVFGDGPVLPELQQAVENDHLHHRVRLMGTVPEDQLLTFYCTKADIFAFPSYHREGFPMAFFYAVGCGLPIVSTRVRPIPDYLSEPDNCLWAAPHDPADFARQLDALLANRDLRQHQSESNRKLVEQFAPRTVARDFIPIYHSVLQRRLFGPSSVQTVPPSVGSTFGSHLAT